VHPETKKPHGFGIAVSQNGTIYEGVWIGGEKIVPYVRISFAGYAVVHLSNLGGVQY